MKFRFLLVLTLAACASAGREYRRWPSSVELTEPAMKDGKPWLMDWESAMQYCKDMGGHLPTAREYTQWLKKYGVKTLEAHEVKAGADATGYDPVDCKNPDGTEEVLYVNSKGYTFPPHSKRKLLFWTSSVPFKHPQFAHVYYEEWGGGGGKPEEHRKSYLNAVMCVRGK